MYYAIIQVYDAIHKSLITQTGYNKNEKYKTKLKKTDLLATHSHAALAAVRYQNNFGCRVPNGDTFRYAHLHNKFNKCECRVFFRVPNPKGKMGLSCWGCGSRYITVSLKFW